MQRAGHARLAAAGVTAREAEILSAVGQRLTNAEIAERMSISVRTVESHVSALLRKLALPGRAAMIELAQQLPGEQAIPAPVTSFVGRDAELTSLHGMLASGASGASGALVSIIGPAGCGKTRLALEAARRWHGETRIVELASSTPRDVGALVAARLGLGYEASDLIAASRMALAGTDLLLVVDNCEHVTGVAADLLGELAAAVPGLHILATSREGLGIDAEQVMLLRPLGVPAGQAAADVRTCAAGQLFLDRALAAAPGFRLDDRTAPHVAALCRRLDGLPLAIELAAARVRNLDIAELADGLQHHLGDIERPAGGGRHRSLRSAIEWSWQLLAEPERALLRRLAVLPGEFTLLLAAAACAGPPGPPGPPGLAGQDLRAALVRLAERSLVTTRLAAGEPARYSLLGVIRAFALEQPDPAADEQVPRAHAAFFSDVAADAVSARYHATPATPAPASFDEANILAALEWSAGHDPDLADRLLVAVCQLIETEPSKQALELVRDVALASPGQWGSEALAQASLVLAYLSLDDAQRLANDSAAAAITERDRMFARWASGWVHAYRHAEADALRQLDAVAAYAQHTGDPWLEGSALQARGVARGSAPAAFSDWEQAVTCFVVAGDLMHANNVRYMLASRAVDTRTRLADVPVWLDGCEEYAASRGYRHELAHIRRVRGSYLRLQREPGTAWQLLEVALPVFRHAGDFRCTCRVLFELAQLALAGDEAEGDPAVATDLLLQCLAVAVAAGDPAVPGRILADLVTVSAAAGDLMLAARSLGALEAVAQQARRENASPVPASAASPELRRTLAGTGYLTFVDEGRAGGTGLITSLYPR